METMFLLMSEVMFVSFDIDLHISFNCGQMSFTPLHKNPKIIWSDIVYKYIYTTSYV